MEENENTSLGLDENVEGALAYLLGFITGIALLLLEPENKFIRFHAMQSTIIFLPLFIIRMLIIRLPLIGFIVGMIISLIGLIVWLVGMIKAYQGEAYRFPIAGDLAAKQLKTM